ncbi:MAG: transglutaminase domain-containing protein [Clostridium sp.]|uniref:transglutaminase-like domain-containing protein n=1 Tax=Faecalicatena contorta TaxID=39482 RepID=UPI0032166FF8|nr:transglutaminase domain-containing protein [Clostridium sp.]
MKNRKEGKSGIRLFEQKSRETSGGMNRISLFAARALSAGFLAAAWWESLLSVFPLHVLKAWLYGCLFLLSIFWLWLWGSRGKKKILYLAAGGAALIFLAWKNRVPAIAVVNSLANAYLRIHEEGSVPLLLYEVPEVSKVLLAVGIAAATIPIIAVFSLVLVRGKGKAAVIVLLLIPAILSATEGYFPSVRSCGLLVLACGIYFAIGTGSTARSVWGNALTAAVLVSVLCAVSWGAAGRIEAQKTVENGVYIRAQAAIEKHVIQRLEEAAGASKEEEEPKEKEEEKPEEPKDTAPEENQDNEIQNEEDTQEGLFPNAGGTTAGIPHDLFSPDQSTSLQNIGYFQPGDGKGLVVASPTRPESTVYLPLTFGAVYQDSTWKAPEENDEIPNQYRGYPGNLTRLISLCEKQETHSAEEAAEFIQKEFEENTVYDYEPGATPSGQDFAEYFLFENKKGFCVHFATTAVLMYRIMGYTARYAEGYAIPPSAYKEQPDGSYRAEVTGDMGHAWCETYEDKWVIREHTLPYTGDSQAAIPPASASKSAVSRPVLSKPAQAILTALLLAFLCTILTATQAAVRRKKKANALQKYAQGKGITEICLAFCAAAAVLGTNIKTPFSTDSFETLKKVLPALTEQDCNTLRQAAQKAMYDKTPPPKETHQNLYALYLKTSKHIQKDLPLIKKLQYRYIKCLP